MIVLNAPAMPPHLEIVTSTPEENAVELALRIARIPFDCRETYPSMVDWVLLHRELDQEVTFMAYLRQRTPIYVVPAALAPTVDRTLHQVIDGADGVLNLAALLASLA